MGKGKGTGENSKKTLGNARKAAAAADRQSKLDAMEAEAEDELWSQGAKSKNGKKEDAAAKKEKARLKKLERDQELESETAAAASKKPVITQKKSNAKSSISRGRGIDAALAESTGGNDLYAHNIDDAIAALEVITGKSSNKVERHPERRFKSALRNYEERRLPEIRKEHPGLKTNQYQQKIFEEFKKSDENPFNQVKVAFNASREDIKETLVDFRRDKEERLKHQSV